MIESYLHGMAPIVHGMAPITMEWHQLFLDRLKSSPLHTHQIIHDDGTVEIPAVAKEVLFPFILSQEGNVRLLEPADLKAELKSKLQKMLDQY